MGYAMTVNNRQDFYAVSPLKHEVKVMLQHRSCLFPNYKVDKNSLHHVHVMLHNVKTRKGCSLSLKKL